MGLGRPDKAFEECGAMPLCSTDDDDRDAEFNAGFMVIRPNHSEAARIWEGWVHRPWDYEQRLLNRMMRGRSVLLLLRTYNFLHVNSHRSLGHSMRSAKSRWPVAMHAKYWQWGADYLGDVLNYI